MDFQCIFKRLKAKKEIFSKSWAKYICRHFYFLAQFLFTTSKIELHYYHQRVNVRDASRVAKKLNTSDLRKFQENSLNP